MPSLLEMFNVFEDQTARQRVKAAMRIVASEVRQETLAVDASDAEINDWKNRRKVAERWRENPAHWVACVIDTISDLPEIVALGQEPAKADDQLPDVTVVDDAVLSAVRGAVDAWKSRV